MSVSSTKRRWEFGESPIEFTCHGSAQHSASMPIMPAFSIPDTDIEFHGNPPIPTDVINSHGPKELLLDDSVQLSMLSGLKIARFLGA